MKVKFWKFDSSQKNCYEEDLADPKLKFSLLKADPPKLKFTKLAGKVGNSKPTISNLKSPEKPKFKELYHFNLFQ